MWHSINRKLFLLTIISLLLSVMIAVSFYNIHTIQHRVGEDATYLANIRVKIDSLRGQLWFFTQNGDEGQRWGLLG